MLPIDGSQSFVRRKHFAALRKAPTWLAHCATQNTTKIDLEGLSGTMFMKRCALWCKNLIDLQALHIFHSTLPTNGSFFSVS
jgi:hypothetical protein